MECSKRASVIIVAHNGIKYLGPCLSSLRRELGPRDELIIVDNASIDGSVDLVRSQWPQALVIQNMENTGFGAACNSGAEHAQGGHLVFLNQDTEVLPGWLDALLDALESDDTVGLSTSAEQYLAEPGMLHSAGADLHYSGLIFLRGTLQPADDFDRGIEKVQSIVGASFAIRTGVWRELGGFDPEFFMYYEEMDLSWRAQLAGYECRYAPTSVVYHHVPLSSVSPGKLHYICRNRLLSLLGNWRWPTLLLLTPGLALAELAEFGYVALAGRWRGIWEKLTAYSWLLRNCGRVTTMRRERRSIRRVPDWVLLKERTWTLQPREFTGGRVGQALARIASIPLYVNGWLAWLICRCVEL